jgi:hypothetical protein
VCIAEDNAAARGICAAAEERDRLVRAGRVGFTGTRHGMTDAQKATVYRLLRERESTWVHHGDCIGADDQFHDLAKTAGHKVMLHPPEKRDLRAFRLGDDVAFEKPYLDRNRDIVNASAVLIAAPAEDEEQPKGGTWYTIRYARQRGCKVIIVWPDGSQSDRPVEGDAPGDAAFHQTGPDQAGQGSGGTSPGDVAAGGEHEQAAPSAVRSAGAEVGQDGGLLFGHDSIISNGHSEIVVRQGFPPPDDARTLTGQRGSSSGRDHLTLTGQGLSAAGSADPEASSGQSRRSAGAKENLEPLDEEAS